MAIYSILAQASGSLTAPGTICTLPTTAVGSVYQQVHISRATFWTIELDGEDIGTAALIVAVQTFNINKGAYFAPTVPAWNAISVTNATKQMLAWTGPLYGIQVNVASFGTSTGTFRAHILGLG
ncbi:MAG: hypothetical protein DMG76_23745 [Acidobacteria bacterium]|nr:MAG: hypothetical protein DMG76_23745 [Acidobacteriota bacterium]